MARTLPPPGFANASLHLHTVAAGLLFGRIYLGTYPDPLGFGKTPSRSAIHAGANSLTGSGCSIWAIQ